jgi:hypothetical protein
MKQVFRYCAFTIVLSIQLQLVFSLNCNLYLKYNEKNNFLLTLIFLIYIISYKRFAKRQKTKTDFE